MFPTPVNRAVAPSRPPFHSDEKGATQARLTGTFTSDPEHKKRHNLFHVEQATVDQEAFRLHWVQVTG